MSYPNLPTLKVGKILKEILAFLSMSYSASSFGNSISKRCFYNVVVFLLTPYKIVPTSTRT